MTTTSSQRFGYGADDLTTVEAAGFTDVEVLKDVDALALFADEVPQEAAELLERTGVEVVGKCERRSKCVGFWRVGGVAGRAPPTED